MTPIEVLRPNSKLAEEWALRSFENIDAFWRSVAGLLFCAHPEGAQIYGINRKNGLSGYGCQMPDGSKGELTFAPLFEGGFVVRGSTFNELGPARELFHIFSDRGHLLRVEKIFSEQILFVGNTEMEPRCPVLSHLYNILSYEYDQAGLGFSRPDRIHQMEQFLKSLEAPAKLSGISLAFDKKDLALRKIDQRAIEAELNPVLTWDERQVLLKSLKADRNRIVQTKRRTHALRRSTYLYPAQMWSLHSTVMRIKKRPMPYVRGYLYRYTIGVMIWFLKTIKGNIGYSIALALYGPFTFYFITQPLNPHAMSVVAKVRSAYLKASETMLSALHPNTEAAIAPESAEVNTITTVGADNKNIPLPVKTEKIQATLLEFPLGTDSEKVDSQDWEERMSHFKNMQIAYERNLQFSARMGRLEEIESQINFPMAAQAAWVELERYLAEISRRQKTLESESPKLAEFLKQEVIRAERAQLYIWDRVARYLRDFPFLAQDASHEQVVRDPYMSASLTLLAELTQKLRAAHPNLKLPSGFEDLAKQAEEVRKHKRDSSSVLGRLQKNSVVFRQKNPDDAEEFRTNISRQWEILYLLQNKAQEASNFGLQFYLGSIKNSLNVIQSIYSAKLQELQLLGQKDLSKAELKAQIKTNIEPVYESQLNFLMMDSLSVRPEFEKYLQHDIESAQRRILLSDFKKSFAEREEVVRALAP